VGRTGFPSLTGRVLPNIGRYYFCLASVIGSRPEKLGENSH